MVAQSVPATRPPESVGGRLRVVGPGLVIAATGVGAGDLVSSIVAGQRCGTALLWAIVIVVVLKYALAEGIGRWYVDSGTTILEGRYSLDAARSPSGSDTATSSSSSASGPRPPTR